MKQALLIICAFMIAAQNLFAQNTITFDDQGWSHTNNIGEFDITNNGKEFNFSCTSSNPGYQYRTAGNFCVTGAGSVPGAVFFNGSNVTSAEFYTTDGSEFDFQGLDFWNDFLCYSCCTLNVTLTGYRDGSPVPGATYSLGNSAAVTVMNTNADDDFNNVDRIVITATGPDGDVLNSCFLNDVRWGAAVPDASTWDGSSSTNWNTAANWSTNAVPTSSDDVVIPSGPGNQPHVTLGPGTPAECANLTVESGATLSVDAGKALTVSGDTDNEGTILVKADATGIGSFIDNGTITGSGSFQMEQYLTGSGSATPDGVFYYVSSPMASATSNVYNAAGTDKLWSADETSQSYPEITDNTTSLSVTEGYVARLGATGTKTFAGGVFNTGNQSASGLTRTGTSETNRGYNLVGNPYPSTVDWDDLGRTNLETTMWYRTNNAGTMTFDTYNATGMVGTNNNGGGAVDGTIPPTQAFWVRVDADGNTGQLDFENADRSHGTLVGIYKAEAQEGLVRMALSDGNISDEAIVMFDVSAQDNFDNYDSHKFWAANIPQLYMNLQEDTLVINGLNNTLTNPTVPLGMKVPAQGNYTLNANDITVVGETVHLEDVYLNIFQDLNVESNYAFTSDAGNIGDRFVLHFGMSAVGVEDGEAMNSRVYSSNGNQLNVILTGNIEIGNAQVIDMAGRTVDSFNLNTSRTTLGMNVNAGVYLIRVETEKGTDTHRILID